MVRQSASLANHFLPDDTSQSFDFPSQQIRLVVVWSLLTSSNAPWTVHDVLQVDSRSLFTRFDRQMTRQSNWPTIAPIMPRSRQPARGKVLSLGLRPCLSLYNGRSSTFNRMSPVFPSLYSTYLPQRLFNKTSLASSTLPKRPFSCSHTT